MNFKFRRTDELFELSVGIDAAMVMLMLQLLGYAVF